MKALNLLLAGALAMGMWSCSSDEPVPDPTPGPDSKGDVYATLTLALPGSRSETNTPGGDNGDYPASSTNGNEVGKDYENNVDAIYVVLAQRDATTQKFTYAAKSYSSSVKNQSNSAATFTIIFQSDDLEKLVGKGPETVYVFTYCNPSATLKTYLDGLTSGEFVDEVYTLANENDESFAAKNNFLMTNALLRSKEIPAHSTLIKENNTVATAFDLGEVKVERVACRFDLEEKPADGDLPKNAYTIDDNVSGLPIAYVEVNGMALINEAKEFYYLPRMAAADQDWTTTTDLCGYERGIGTGDQNYVVSPNYSLKNEFAAGTLGYDGISDNYFFNIGMKPNQYNYTWVTSTEDNDGWTGAAGTSYKIWRYATENTMPVNAQKHGITTGIIFRAEMKALPKTMWGTVEGDAKNPAETFANALTTGETIYAYTQTEAGKDLQVNTMLGTAKDVWAYAYTHKQSEIRSKFVSAVAAGKFTVTIGGTAVTTEDDIFPEVKEDGTYKTFEELLAAVKVTMFAANSVNDGGQYVPASNYNFVAYAPDEDGHYYTYYYYYNKHNDRYSSDAMGIMEFATVRNNIYKLKVSTVAGFGQPGDVTPTPGTNDKTPEVYFQVSALVLDWVVRVNPVPLQ